MRLFGIDQNHLARQDPKGSLLALLGADIPSQVVTLNPEMALAARQNAELRDVINHASLVLADGFGIALVTGADRLTGVDALALLVSEAAKRGMRVMFLGGVSGEAATAADVLRQRYPGLLIEIDEAGTVQKTATGWKQDSDLLERIRSFQPTVLAVAFGHGKQETWIADHLAELPSVRVAIGVGGTFAFLSGRIQRAPAWLRAVGLEWAWRLVQEPRRIGRIFQAVVVFPITLLWDNIANKSG